MACQSPGRLDEPGRRTPAPAPEVRGNDGQSVRDGKPADAEIPCACIHGNDEAQLLSAASWGRGGTGVCGGLLELDRIAQYACGAGAGADRVGRWPGASGPKFL